MSSSSIKSLVFGILVMALLMDLLSKKQVLQEESIGESTYSLEELEVVEEILEEVAEFQDEIVTMIEDNRDETEYPVLTVGGIRWMLKNLSYNMDGAVCYDLEPHCENIGKLYTYEAALRACPDGWRLPKKREWEYLIKHYLDNEAFQIQGQILLGNRDIGVTMSGVRTSEGQFLDYGDKGYYWSQLDYDADTAFGYQFSDDYRLVGGYQNKYAKDWQLSCLCVQSVGN